MTRSGLARRVAAVRGFNRFYTKQIGLLTDAYLKTPFSLTEARVIYELAHRGETTATSLGKELGLDAGYLSRILRSFKKRGLIDKKPAPADRRQGVLRLTVSGQAAFAALDAHSHGQIEAMLRRLRPGEQDRLLAAMRTVERLLGPAPGKAAPYRLRPHRPGDMGWVVQRHGALYAREYGWDQSFEALVAGITARFIERFDPRLERCWIAERDGENLGCVFLVKKTRRTAKLRMLLVEPDARGAGIGARLVAECIRFARRVGYRKITLWTNSILVSARRIYEKQGFRLIASEPYHRFGHDLVSETWERAIE